MSEILNIPPIETKPELWGVSIKWKWPEGCIWGHRLELQYLFSDGRLEKEFIPWPVSEKLICGLKAGERLQIRLRLIDKNGDCRDWLSGDWVDGVSSTNAGDYVNDICGTIKASYAMTVKSDRIRSIAAETKLRLSDDMREAVADVVNDAIRNALKPGGLLNGR